MPFTFKLSKRLALSKAVRTTAARALSALRQVSPHPALVVPTPRTSVTPSQTSPSSQVGPFVVPTNAPAEEILS
jgi:hypothetical protein